MTAGVLPAFLVRGPTVSVVPRLEPYLVEVAVPYPVGSADRAVAAAIAVIEQFLSGQTLNGFTVATPLFEDDSHLVANTAFVQAIGRLVEQAAKNYADAQIQALVKRPGMLSAMLPDTPPDTPDTPWRDRDGIAFTPPATGDA